jgi:hypothetical protein
VELRALQIYQSPEHWQLQESGEPPKIKLEYHLGKLEPYADAAVPGSDLTENKEPRQDEKHLGRINGEADRCGLKRRSRDQLPHQAKKSSRLSAATLTTADENVSQNLRAPNSLTLKVLELEFLLWNLQVV